MVFESIWLESVWQDLRFGWRMMRKTPLVTFVAIGSLALSIGANTAIFTLLNAVVLRALPVKDPASVVVLSWLAKSEADRPQRSGGVKARIDSNGRLVDAQSFAFPYAAFEYFHHTAVTLSGVFAYYDDFDRINVVANGIAEVSKGVAVSASYHRVLGISPAIGRTFTDEDDRESAPPVAIISYRFWENRLQLDPTVVGKVITINKQPFTVVGVEQRGFLGLQNGSAQDILIPLHQVQQLALDIVPDNKDPFHAADFWVRVGGRLAAGCREDRSRAELNVIFHQALRSSAPSLSVELKIGGEGENPIRDRFRNPLLVLMILVSLVLLVAIGNIANLLLSRAAARETETMTRRALGAGQWRSIQHWLIEGLLLCTLGGSLGVLLAQVASRALASFYDWVFDLGPDWHVLCFTAAITMFTGIFFSLAPAFYGIRADIHPRLRRGNRTPRFVRVLVIGQVALALVVLVGAGLYLRTLQKLRSLNLGINLQGLLVFNIEPSLSGYNDEEAGDLCQRLITRLEHLPGIQTATLSWYIPFTPSGALTTLIAVDGMAQTKNKLDLMKRNVAFNAVGPHYFQTMGMPLLLGRGIEERDRMDTTRVAVINEQLARTFFPKQIPMGRRIRSGKTDYQVVGVVHDSKYSDIRKVSSQLFTAYFQRPANHSVGIELRAVGSPKALIGYVRHAVKDIDPELPVLDLRTEEENISAGLRQERLFANLSGCFGLLVVLLAAIGIYGVRAHSVERRTHEFGVRMALGARPAKIIALVLGETAWLFSGGVALGLGVALVTTRLIESMLFGITARDWATFVAAIAVLLTTTGVAGYLPALRAARVDPLVALRHD